MRKFTLLFLILVLTGSAYGDMTRSQNLQRAEQVLTAWRDGKIWTARFEEGEHQGNLYLQSPGKFAVAYDHGIRIFTKGDELVRAQGGALNPVGKTTEDPLWIIAQGEVGKTVRVDMVAEETINYFGREVDCVVVDLVTTIDRSFSQRARVYVRASGASEIIRINSGSSVMWLRDFRQEQPVKDPFTHSIL